MEEDKEWRPPRICFPRNEDDAMETYHEAKSESDEAASSSTTPEESMIAKGDNSDSADDENIYSEESHEFDASEYGPDLLDAMALPSSLPLGVGCNHRATCSSECRIYHDYNEPPRKHYHWEDTTSHRFTRTHYGRYVREAPDSIAYIRLDDDDADKWPRREHGWHHKESCPIDCRRYHYDYYPQRWRRDHDNEFVADKNGRWVSIYAGNLACEAYIRIGPNDPCQRKIPLAQARKGPATLPNANALLTHIRTSPLYQTTSINDLVATLQTINNQRATTAPPPKRKAQTIKPVVPANNKRPKKEETATGDHQWHEDATLSTKKMKIYCCSCPLEKEIHYRRLCSSGDACLGNRYRNGKSRGYCNTCRLEEK